jgi:4-hydroxythreonine-4-phosphate dehydrogenase
VNKPRAACAWTPERRQWTPNPSTASRAGATLNAAVIPGRLDPANAGYVLDTLRLACDGCLDGRFDAMVTAPVHKGIINDAGLPFTGHTEFLAERCNASPVMMLTAPGLRVALAPPTCPCARCPMR